MSKLSYDQKFGNLKVSLIACFDDVISTGALYSFFLAIISSFAQIESSPSYNHSTMELSCQAIMGDPKAPLDPCAYTSP